ncbi:methionine ABC transporter ATP-binding protein MetN [uncultured Ferrimonas sp.]|uniref:methionine ABC transporter ATP-binding protein MetN n=1 Tax=uncultured Ferrimonas sp. TaxID=432640 RepID=UPI00261A0D42|nr:methionine ABC transporter ATP-binding protein MetN [uncultured Ferrimonas sp.]
MITLSAISKTYQSGSQCIEALKPTDLHVAKGKIFGIIGSSGAGKSTLIRCVNLLERPDSGAVIINGTNLLTLSEAQLRLQRQQVAMIFQHFNLLANRTVYANVALPLELAGKSKAQIRAKIEPLLELVGLTDKASSYPANLSGGQKQRVAIARALANDPKVLLCDEATSALDPNTTRSVLQLLKAINQKLGLTILLITHEMDVVKQICDQVALIDNGELVEQGDVGRFFAAAKTPLAQHFVRSTLHVELPEVYQQQLQVEASANTKPIIQLRFHGDSVDAPVITQVAQQFNVDISIISAQMEYIGANKFGLLLAELLGQNDAIDQAITTFQQHNIDVEVLGYVN